MKIRLIIAILAILSNFATAKPRLVVNIVVGQMRYDYLLRFRDNFSENGFKKMIHEGVSCDRAMYNYLTTSTPSGLATITTGSNPSTHGVTGLHWFDYTTGKRVDLLTDNASQTVGSDALDTRISPSKLTASTLSDALKAISPGSKVVSIALEPTSAVIMGGHSADAAYWLSAREGNMVTSNYYTQTLPEWVQKFNGLNQPTDLIRARWTSVKPSAVYKNVFRKDIGMEGNGTSLSPKFDYDTFAASPAANQLLREFAVQAIINDELGKDDKTDMLNIVFDPMRLMGEKYGTNSIEIEDAYYRFDGILESLINFLDVQLGRSEYVITLSSDHGAIDPMIESSRMPSGRLDVSQFLAIINGFLGGQFGSGERWALDYSYNRVFLNRPLIFTKGLDLKEIQDKVAQYAVQFSGVAQAITAYTLQSSSFNSGILNKAQNSYYQRNSGDVMINYLPGWAEKNDRQSDSGSSYIYDTHVPLIFFGDGIGSQNIAREVDMIDLAATIAHIMEVAPPNASTGKPITEIYEIR